MVTMEQIIITSTVAMAEEITKYILKDIYAYRTKMIAPINYYDNGWREEIPEYIKVDMSSNVTSGCMVNKCE